MVIRRCRVFSKFSSGSMRATLETSAAITAVVFLILVTGWPSTAPAMITKAPTSNSAAVLGQIDPNGSYDYGNVSTGCQNCANYTNLTPIANAGVYVNNPPSSPGASSGNHAPMISPWNGGSYKVGAYINYTDYAYPEVRVSIVLPNIGPRAGDYYGVLLSAFDSALTYDQIGIVSDYKVCTANPNTCNVTGAPPTTNDNSWYVGWVAAPGCGQDASNWGPNNSTQSDFIYHRTWNPDAFALTQGEQYTFEMKLGAIVNGKHVLTFNVYSGIGVNSAPIWTLNHIDGAIGFNLNPTTICNGTKYYGYTEYEEVHSTSSQQYPNWPFNFTAPSADNAGNYASIAWNASSIGSSPPTIPHGYPVRTKTNWGFVEIDNEAFGLYDANGPVLVNAESLAPGGHVVIGAWVDDLYGYYCSSNSCPEYIIYSNSSVLTYMGVPAVTAIIGYTPFGSIGHYNSRFWVNITVASSASSGVYPIWVETQWNPTSTSNTMVEYTSTNIYVVVS